MRRAAILALLLAGCGRREKEPEPQPERAAPTIPTIVRSSAPAGAPIESDEALDSSEFRADIEKEIFRRTNAERSKRGFRELEWSEDAARAARYQSRCLARHKLLAHDSVPCGSLRGRLDHFGIVFLGSENLDFIAIPGPLDRTLLRGRPIAAPGGPPPSVVLADSMVQDWLDSIEHRKNLLNPDVNELGVGVYWKEGGVYGTQVFLIKVDCGRKGLACCVEPAGRRYCWAPDVCDDAHDVCRRE